MPLIYSVISGYHSFDYGCGLVLPSRAILTPKSLASHLLSRQEYSIYIRRLFHDFCKRIKSIFMYYLLSWALSTSAYSSGNKNIMVQSMTLSKFRAANYSNNIQKKAGSVSSIKLKLRTWFKVCLFFSCHGSTGYFSIKLFTINYKKGIRTLDVCNR